MSGGAKPVTKWTPEQRAGIETTGRSLLVSAAAGSGKTAVLSARCAHLVCDAAPPCDVDQLLVVTFTEAAAAEMKGRIEAALRQRLAGQEDDPRLVKQLALVERAHVSTLHGFCSRLLRQNFHLLGLDPGFAVLDGDEGKLLRNEVARELFAERYENDPEGHFGRLVRFYAGGNDEALIPHLLKTHEMLGSLVDPQAWLSKARRRIEEAATGRLEDSEAGHELKQLLAEKIAALKQRCATATRTVASFEGLGKYVDYLNELAGTLDDWSDRLEKLGIDALAQAVQSHSNPRLPSIKGEVEGKTPARNAIDGVREEMDSKGTLAQIARFSRAQWQAGLHAIAPSAAVLLDLVEEFGRRYRRAKDQSRRLDFNDLERFALRILRQGENGLEPSPVARGYHQQFHHVLVDEYQDINEVQDAILHLVSRECLANKAEGGRQKAETEKADLPDLFSDSSSARPPSGLVPNLFCVGDVKQSIYRFRLAEPDRFLQRYAHFKSFGRDVEQIGSDAAGQVIDLQANFRSRGPLLHILNEIFLRLMTREAADIEYDASHHLRPGASFPPGDETCFTGAPVELHLLPQEVPPGGEEDDEPLDRSEREAQFVARRIRQLMGLDGGRRMSVAERTSGGLVSRPIQYRDIVILLRSMKVKADQYADALRAADIPVFREGGQGYFQSMEVRDMRALLTLLDNPQQDIPLAAVLRSPLAGLPHPEDCLARIRLAYPHESGLIPFHRAVPRYAQENDDELAAALRDFLKLLHNWRQLARHRPLAELIWEIYNATGYLAFCQGLTNGQQRVANLLELHERAAQFGSFSRQGLYRFLKFLDSLEAETDFGQPSVLSESADVVRIMSVHHSKGLEFPVVFLPELGKRINLQDCYGAILMDKRAGLALSAVDEEKRIRYPSLASVLVQTSLKRQSLAEELRVLYVAATRAKEHLILSGTASDSRREQWNTRWSGHVGPMPADDFLSATCMLDWIGPVVSMIGSETSFRVTGYAPDEVASWSAAELKRPALSDFQERLARLEPLNPPPPPDARARQLIQTLVSPYPHVRAARQEAARSVTDLTKKDRQAPVGYVVPLSPGAADRSLTFERTLATPGCLQDRNDLSAADVGSATHLIFQHLDFSRPCSDEDLAEQINHLIDRKLLTAAQAKHVDLGAIQWFIGTDVGRRLRENAPHLRRELDFYLAVAPEEFEATQDALAATPVITDSAGDQVMIRGRIDALIVPPAAAPLTLIDYKTDRLAPEKVPARADFYAPQVQLYRRAIERITGRTVGEVILVFLAARSIVST
jgi:ATP-dependent helicase/nuclease subunit A